MKPALGDVVLYRASVGRGGEPVWVPAIVTRVRETPSESWRDPVDLSIVVPGMPSFRCVHMVPRAPDGEEEQHGSHVWQSKPVIP